VWVLPFVQLLWVNAHGLFVLGPIILATYVADGLYHTIRGARSRDAATALGTAPWWKHVVPASLAVIGACFVNPYGLEGTFFPLVILPKITSMGEPYKSYIVEFNAPRNYMHHEVVALASRQFFAQTQTFVCLLLVTSLMIPAIWSAWISSGHEDVPPSPKATTAWLAGLAMVWFLIIVAVLGLPIPGLPEPLIAVARWVPAAFAVLGIVAALALARRSSRAALLAGCAGIMLAVGIPWLHENMWGVESSYGGPSLVLSWTMKGMLLLVTVITVFLALESGTRLFHFALTAAFGSLILMAIRNSALFGLVSGYLIVLNLGPWLVEVWKHHPPSRAWTLLGLAGRAGLFAIIVAGIVAKIVDRASAPKGFLARVGLRDFDIGFREKPFYFAHDAVRFAGRPDMPKRALVFDLVQSAVYLFHNAPERKPFMDPRLEVPSEETFKLYVRLAEWIQDRRPVWVTAVERMGNPLILLDHEKSYRSEATLVSDPRWRCVYFDNLASVYLPKSRQDLEAAYPTVDFAARFFQDRPWTRGRRTSKEARLESRGMDGMGWALLAQPSVSWTLRIPVLLLGAAFAREAVALAPDDPQAWFALGDAYWNLTPDPDIGQLRVADPWDITRALADAQGTYAYRRAVEIDPSELGALITLQGTYRLRGMDDAFVEATEMALRYMPRTPPNGGGPNPRPAVRDEPLPVWQTTEELSNLVPRLLRGGRPLVVSALARQAEERGIALPWELADSLARTDLAFGDPAAARRMWERAGAPPSPAVQKTRIAVADLVALDYEKAEKEFREALRLDPKLGEAWYGLAVLQMQLARASETLEACDEGLKCTLTATERAAFDGMRSLVARFRSEGSLKTKD
jgi:tetratricopeptide (TPR) repeat protein